VICDSIPGWFAHRDLYRSFVEQAEDGAVFVELGTYLGHSAACMAELIRDSGKKIRFYTVDDYLDHPVIPKHYMSQTTANLRELLPWVSIVVGPSNRRIPGVDRVDFCWIDAAHDTESVLNDIACWAPISQAIGGDDYTIDGVGHAVRSSFTLYEVQLIGRGWLVARNPYCK
jgi:hypothetical protein